MDITAGMVKELRERTGAGMMDCKKALVETNGDMEKAVEYLREKGLGKATKKADRLASEGLAGLVIDDENTKASLVEINSETDFVAKNDKFINLVNDTVNHIQNNNIKDNDTLNDSSMNGVNFDEFLKTQIATIGENIVVRRFTTIKDEVVNGYVHSNGRVAVAIAAKCGKSDKKKVAELLRNIAMHAAAMKPSVISYKDLDPEFVKSEVLALKGELEKENEELARLGKTLHHIPQYGSRLQLTDEVIEQAKKEIEEELKAEGKPEKIWDRILPGKLDRFIADNTVLDQRLTLLGQFYVMDDKKTIEQVLEEKSKDLGDKIEITSYIRYEVGEGLEKKVEDFAAEVAAQIGK
ncbi:translation elongation factor EF-Ts [Campylobacter blaseri]|uniref:Elongation factor Ts n=1 Tax=Campylobacter blaseri TaxID=2042961 RepID=A0A2P8R0N1_9BACT|nr:translation elongation factor Ts [Campylobacter blaseri]PSM52048.1 elongation factor Ts [Campylobacter blaseri]PSM53833.1 elongation factor Ts [Campylobacter blaseri]QKF85615.1 translation elongation factor EF-Ts [Campylobacter blaseri]